MVARSVSSHNDRKSKCSYTGRNLRSSLASLDRISDKLNDRMVDKMVKMIEDKEREERRENIVIRGIKTGETIGVEWVRRFLRSRLGIEAKILTCKKSDDVIVAKVENEEKKREIMVNKNRLGKDKIFIENNLT